MYIFIYILYIYIYIFYIFICTYICIYVHTYIYIYIYIYIYQYIHHCSYIHFVCLYKNIMKYFLNTFYRKFGFKIYQQIINVLMGSDRVPFMNNLF